MPHCPHCDTEIDDVDDLKVDRKGSETLAVGMFSCPSCDVVLAVSGAGRNATK